MNASSQHLVLVAGEASGDMHAAQLVNEFKKLRPSITFSGVGGQQMKAAGVELIDDLTPLALIGFWEVVKHYGEIRKVFYRLLNHILTVRPAAVILVDYPGFNLRLARKLKHHGIKVIYYISPQVWAWKAERIRQIKADIDRMLVLFEFEKKWYQERGLDVDFVGHPLIDTAKPFRSREDVLRSLGLDPKRITIGVLPGSRRKEVEKILPVMLAAAHDLTERRPNWQFVILKAPGLPHDLINSQLKNQSFPLTVSEGPPYDVINACDAAMVASGTATLETAILGKPMVVVYKTSPLTYWLARMLIKIPYIGLVNVVAGRKIVPECIQQDANASTIAGHLEGLVTNDQLNRETKQALAKVKESLGAPGASRRAAEAILKFLFR